MNIPSVPTNLIPSLVQQNNTLESDLLRKLWANKESMLQNPIGGVASDSTASVNSLKNYLTVLGSNPSVGSTVTDNNSFSAEISKLSNISTMTTDYSAVCGRMMTGTTGTMSLPDSFSDISSDFNIPTVQETIGLVQHEQSLNNRLADPSDTNTDYCSAVTNTIGNLVNGGKEVISGVKDSCNAVLSSITSSLSSATQSKVADASSDKALMDSAAEIRDSTQKILDNTSGYTSDQIVAIQAAHDQAVLDYEKYSKAYYGTPAVTDPTTGVVTPATPGSQSAAAAAAASDGFDIHSLSTTISDAAKTASDAYTELKSTVSNTVTAINTAVNNAVHDALINSLAAIRSLNPCMKAVTDGNGTDGILTPATKALYDSYDQAKAIANNTP